MEKVIPVRVALRCRPLIPREVTEGCQLCVRFTPNEPQIVLGVDKAFTYDFVYSQIHSQVAVYEAVQPLIGSIMKGCNATVLAYGQTGSGKTYTMGGCFCACSAQEEDENELGVIPRVLRDLFSSIDKQAEEKLFTVKVSYLEIHNEDLHDLLCPPAKRESLSIREELQGAIKIQGLREVLVTSYEETLRCFAHGSMGRTTGATAMNNTSSRSHAIFTIHIEQTSKTDGMDIVRSKFHLVDLAGSERAKRTQAEGERFKEGININKGLLALGNVISALGDETQKRSHIPYRDSKLTRLLQDSLGGNSDTLMIACVSPADTNLEETLNTLRYADRARKIKNKPIINRDPQTAEIMRLKSLVQELQVQLIQGGGTEGLVGGTVLQDLANSNYNSSNEKTWLNKLKALEDENMELSQELQLSVEQNTKSLERAIQLELVRDKLKGKLQEFKTQTGVDFELLSTSIDPEINPNVKEELEKLRKLAETLRSQSDDEKDDNLFYAASDDIEEEDRENIVYTPDTRAISNQYVLRQAQMGRELEELNRLLARKEELANQMTHNDSKMDSMREQYEQTVKDMESKVAELQHEKEKMSQALIDARTNSAASKVSEQRRKRLQELENQISSFRKKINEQNKMLKMKDQSEKQVYKLNADIQSMKQQRVKLMKQMKEDAEQFRKWKQQKDKEVLQLQQKGRKQQFEIQKMQKSQEKQQLVLRRKTEEAAAANKRLKDALARQRAVMEERSQKLDKYDSTSIGKRVRSWLSHELDVRVGISEAKYHLSSLLSDRKLLTSQVTALKSAQKNSMEDKSFDEKQQQKEIKTLENEIELRNVQIADIQQKIVDADQDSKGKSTWESLHTMTEAKIALKWLLDQAVTAKADVSVTRSELKEAHEVNTDTSHSAELLEEDIKTLKQQHETEITTMQKEHEEKILYLLCQLNADSEKINTSLDEEVKKKLKFQEMEIEKFSNLHEQLTKKTEENETLKKQLTRAMYQGKKMALMPSIMEPGTSPFLSPVPKPTRKPKTKPKEKEEVITLEELFEDWDDEPSAGDSDSDWQPTPKFKRHKPKIAKRISSVPSSENSSMNSTFSVDDEKANAAALKTKQRRRTKVVLKELGNDVVRSSDEFQKPLVNERRKRSSQGRPKSESGELEKSSDNDSQKVNSQEKVTEIDHKSVLKGGIKKRRLHDSNRSSLFSPLT
ncbi:chromosome-associated kinesin KIF4A-like isoform X2 [Gigantopelta aegis]|uniref:chromosome-associated kinesin KIF4A-like isoform X2 n=1 Tax=Gigantopelta aegis TaxID=1735272 RepID=UPI001B889F55|nr:chromosome-associated kinesin KIF4A-like isoform X2 [Gigantopelta aegis]